MAKRINKYLYLWVVQGLYHTNWEDVTAEETYSEGRQRLKEYRENEPQYLHRIIQRRELNPEWKGN